MIHNGIIENFARLRAELEADGVEFASDTDTECAAHLLERELAAVRAEGDADAAAALTEAMRRVCRRLDGAFTLLAVDTDTPDVVVGARRNSPLVVGRGQGENYLAFDVAAFVEHTRDAIELGQDQVVMLTPETIEITDFEGNLATGKDFHIDWDAAAAEKGGYDHFMLKEIAEQPWPWPTPCAAASASPVSSCSTRCASRSRTSATSTRSSSSPAARRTTPGWWPVRDRALDPHPLRGRAGQRVLRYRDPVLDRSTLVVAISQSGETMDTLMALRHAKEQKARVLAICNTNGSTIPRESDAVLYTHAGPRSPSRPRRRSSPNSWRATWSACTWPRCGA